jgi:diguanylate cyclase (GGDEF)-like protein
MGLDSLDGLARPGTGRLGAVLLAQWGAVLAAAVLLTIPSLAHHSTTTLLICAIVLLLAAASFAITAQGDPASARHTTVSAAWTLLALAYAAVTIVVILHAAWTGGGTNWAVSATLAAANLAQAGAIWLLLQGRAPRWAPSTGWDGPVVALGAAALGTGALELALTMADDEGGMSRPSLVLALAGTILFVVGVTAVAVAAPTPRPQLRWLAGGITIVVAADLIALASRDAPALLTADDDLLSRLLRLASVAGYAVLTLATTSGAAGRRTDRRLRPGSIGRTFTLAAGLVASSAFVVAAAVIQPSAPRAAAGLALACLLVALSRARRSLRAVQLRGRGDPRPRTDDLTGLANRRALSEALAGDPRADGDEIHAGWSGWAGWADEIALLLVDLDRFKDVNEALGHDSGDRLLTEVGARLRTALRPTQLLARLGGDEFAVVLPAAGVQTARRVAQALRESLSEPFEINGSRLYVQASVGVATCHPGSGEPTDLLRQADVAMYQAKSLGTGIEVYDESRDDASGQRLRRTDELRDALERGDLEVHIQPQVDLRTGLICGGEALARWRHPVDGVLLPDSFLPLAEHTGLMRPVAAQLLDRALEACATWWTQGFAVPISVNVGADDLRDAELPERVAKQLQRHSLPPEALCVEITEQALLTDLPAAAALLARWRSDGIAVSIDDFGTGYSSLSYLRELPVDEIKLDQAFIADINRPTTMTIVRHTLAMAHGLWARTVAEGIEDEATARAVADLGCDVGQGLYFGAALTPPEFLARLAR